MSKSRILIVEDEPIIAEDIFDILQEAEYTCVGISHDSDSALDMMISRTPDVILLDINIDGHMDGIQLAEILKNNYNIPYVFLTSHTDEKTLNKAKLTLPYGYVVKPFNNRDLISSIEMALFRHQNENNSLFPSLADINTHLNTSITQKEYLCLIHLSDGLTNKQMASKQFVSVNTIKSHLKNLFLKLEVVNRTHAINKVLTIR